MENRVKIVRKALILTQDEFAGKLGLTGSGISNIESGKRGITEQTLKSICREFTVNPEWLATGNGEMFVQTPLTDKFTALMNGNNEFAKSVIAKLLDYTPLDWECPERILKK